MKLYIVAGARPNFMKIAPLFHTHTTGFDDLDLCLVHTGQHYDYQMSKVFFDDFDIPEPNYFLNVGSGTHAEQTARIMVEFEKVCLQEKPDLVVVVGDVNSTLACSITAKKLKLQVAHIEAGLRSNDMTMPEEINRIITDSISDLLFVTEKSGIENLKKEGLKESQIHFVGNIMIDSLYYSLNKLDNSSSEQGIVSPYAVVTLHRPSNVDNKQVLSEIIEALIEISRNIHVVFPVHPRSEKKLESFGLMSLINANNITLKKPMSYLEFLTLWKHAKLVLTDSGGLQEETTVLGIPCLTIRQNTERPVTLDEGTNILAGTSKDNILYHFDNIMKGNVESGKIPKLWDGKTALRILNIISGRNI